MDKVQKWRKNTKQRCVDALGGKCEVCGYNRCIEALDFHHLDPTKKEYGITNLIERPRSWSETIVPELRKCVLLCANCHREVHAGIMAIEEKQYFNEDFLDYKPKKLFNNCPICGEDKEIFYKTCSNKCAGKLRGKVDWSKIDLPLMLEKFKNPEQIGKHLGVSGAAVRKQIKKLE